MRNLVDELEIESAHADRMAAMAQHWMRAAQDAQRTIVVLVRAAGGEIIVSMGDIRDAPRLELQRMHREDNMTMHFRTKLAEKR